MNAIGLSLKISSDTVLLINSIDNSFDGAISPAEIISAFGMELISSLTNFDIGTLPSNFSQNSLL